MFNLAYLGSGLSSTLWFALIILSGLSLEPASDYFIAFVV
jgi:hypothetical protein